MANKKTSEDEKKWVAVLKSESGDDYVIQFSGMEPKTDQDWLKLFKEHVNNDDICDGHGPGIAGTWLHLEHLIAIEQ